MIRLMIVDDHAAARQEALQHLQEGGIINVIAQCETSDEAWKTAEKLLPDIVLLDLHLPGLLNTYDLLKRLSSLRRVKVIIFASQGKAAEVQDLLDAGACGYMLKSDSSALLRMAILMVSRGSRNVISSSLPRHLTRLSPAERSVLRHITQRGRLPKIAERMGITEEALQSTLDHLSSKLELTGTAQLVKWAKKHGF